MDFRENKNINRSYYLKIFDNLSVFISSYTFISMISFIAKISDEVRNFFIV